MKRVIGTAAFVTAIAAVTAAATAPNQNPQMPWRPPAMGDHGAVTAGHPLAAQAGLDVLRSGGNAVDAAVTMAGVLSVVRPHMNGIGGDTFMLIYRAREKRVYGLNGSGRAGSRASADGLRRRGLQRMPSTGLDAVTVPGTVSAWTTALSRFGTRPLSSLLEPAIQLAFGGFPVSHKLYRDLYDSRRVISRSPALSHVFMPDGDLHRTGDLLVQSRLGESLRKVASTEGESFYRGDLAGELARFFNTEGGAITADDLATHSSEWVEPISTHYRGLGVFALPPNTQGIALLMLLNIIEQFDVDRTSQHSADYLHLLIEAKKLAFADRDEHVADPAGYEAPIDSLLSKAYASQRAQLIDPSSAAREFDTGQPRKMDDDTVVCTAADLQGNVVVLIQSLFNSFGSGVVAGDTGIILQNRGSLFTLERGHPNELAPGHRPYHTLCPCLILLDGLPVLAMATPGGDGQVQTLVQIINNWHLFEMDIQSSVEAPRFRSYDGLDVSLEDSVGLEAITALEARGHRLRLYRTGQRSEFGGAQAIMILRSDPATPMFIAGADPRREAVALAW